MIEKQTLLSKAVRPSNVVRLPETVTSGVSKVASRKRTGRFKFVVDASKLAEAFGACQLYNLHRIAFIFENNELRLRTDLQGVAVDTRVPSATGRAGLVEPTGFMITTAKIKSMLKSLGVAKDKRTNVTLSNKGKSEDLHADVGAATYLLSSQPIALLPAPITELPDDAALLDSVSAKQLAAALGQASMFSCHYHGSPAQQLVSVGDGKVWGGSDGRTTIVECAAAHGVNFSLHIRQVASVVRLLERSAGCKLSREHGELVLRDRVTAIRISVVDEVFPGLDQVQQSFADNQLATISLDELDRAAQISLSLYHGGNCIQLIGLNGTRQSMDCRFDVFAFGIGDGYDVRRRGTDRWSTTADELRGELQAPVVFSARDIQWAVSSTASTTGGMALSNDTLLLAYEHEGLIVRHAIAHDRWGLTLLNRASAIPIRLHIAASAACSGVHA